MLEATQIKDLLHGGWETLSFAPFRPGITAHHFVTGIPSIAVLRYEPGASAPLHEHLGTEMIVVLQGSQTDEFGHYTAGDVIINPPGSRHSVWSKKGCVVLLHWAKPVHFIEP